ncbi:MmpS family transport accessory protein [Mycobacterium sp. MMS18-G62]
MNRPYTAHSPYSLTPTERIQSPRDEELDAEYPALEDYEDYDAYDDEPIDRRWIWIAGVAGAILLVAVICAVVILGGGDSGSVSTTVAPTTTAQPAATTSAPATTPAAAPPPAAPLPPETVTTLTPSASAPPSAAPTQAAPAPTTVTYQVTGNRQLVDFITVIYTDAQGALQTDVNVALPWSRTVVLDPGVTLSSVTATSVGGQLNCSITDGSGATLAAQSNNSMIATCTR